MREQPRLTDDVLASLVETGDLRGGSRTTLRVPEVLERELEALSRELGLTKNEALIRLALTGSQLVERAREVAAKREARREAVFATHGRSDVELPSVEEMRAAVSALRTADD